MHHDWPRAGEVGRVGRSGGGGGEEVVEGVALDKIGVVDEGREVRVQGRDLCLQLLRECTGTLPRGQLRQRSRSELLLEL